MGPLAGVRVLDLSRVLAGPWATQLLADLGAEVIKIEQPGRGDDTRHWGPPDLVAAGDSDGADEALSLSAYFLAANRGKRSVCVDFTRPAGQDIVRRLAQRSDVLVENFKVGGLAQYGLDYATLAQLNPALVYCSITGFGQTGPYADRAGYDFILQGLGGLMSVTGPADGEPGAGPTKVGVAVVDIMTGLYASNAILAALRDRDVRGLGQHLDLALLDVQVATLANQALNYQVSGKSPGRLGNAHPNIVPYQSFETADRPINLAVGNDAQFQKLCQVLERSDLGQDPRYGVNAFRVRHRTSLIAELQTTLARQPAELWLDRLHKAGVPAGPINDVQSVFDDPQVRHRGLALRLPHPTLGEVPSVACPIRFSHTTIVNHRAPPVLGQDTAEVLSETLGLTELAIAALRGEGVI